MIRPWVENLRRQRTNSRGELEPMDHGWGYLTGVLTHPVLKEASVDAKAPGPRRLKPGALGRTGTRMPMGMNRFLDSCEASHRNVLARLRAEVAAAEVAAEKIAAEARSKTIESALDPQNQLTNEQVAALRAEIEQVEYLKRLLARAEQMRNVARAETKQARDKHESDLEIVRKEVAVMDAEMENLRRRVKKDKAKIEAMERTTIEAADEFATLYSRQENTRRLLGACIVAILALVVRLGLSGQTFMMKNMYQY